MSKNCSVRLPCHYTPFRQSFPIVRISQPLEIGLTPEAVANAVPLLLADLPRWEHRHQKCTLRPPPPKVNQLLSGPPQRRHTPQRALTGKPWVTLPRRQGAAGTIPNVARYLGRIFAQKFLGIRKRGGVFFARNSNFEKISPRSIFNIGGAGVPSGGFRFRAVAERASLWAWAWGRSGAGRHPKGAEALGSQGKQNESKGQGTG